ncbi:MAG: succinate--CoA ligase subunit alpha [Candidatus Omnitrophica bacterium]|nr:succinate--CoA ligase subunit alpha [Candidatus Omnitrophota bacterium]
MSILVDQNTKVLVQGITGKHGAFHTERMLRYGTEIVGGVTPGKGGSRFLNVPVFDTMKEAVRMTQAGVSVIYVPAVHAPSALYEAAEAGVRLIVCITEGIPVLEMARFKEWAKEENVQWVGPNCPGIITPGECKIGIMPGEIHTRGPIGVISRSGTLTYEAVWQLTHCGLGQSTCVGIGGDPIGGFGFVDLLARFQDDPETKAVVLIGEIGGTQEEEAARFIREKMSKPVVAFVAGLNAPEGRRMGHAGAIITGGTGRAKSKIECFRDHGVVIAENPALIGETMKKIYREQYGEQES